VAACFQEKTSNISETVHENLNGPVTRPTLSAAKTWPSDFSLWQCKVCADIRGVPWKGASNDSVEIENLDFQYTFRCYIFETLGNKANIII